MDELISMKEFEKCYRLDKLGKLYLPNSAFYSSGSFKVDLKELFLLIRDWKVMKEKKVSLDDIISIISFGSAVKYPGENYISVKRKKYIFFGPEIEGEPKLIKLKPKDADFLLITEQNLSESEIILSSEIDTGYDGGTYLKKGGIHLISRGREQIINSVKNNDTVSISALKEGIPIVYDDRLNNLRKEIRIQSETPRNISWNKWGYDGKFYGKIK